MTSEGTLAVAAIRPDGVIFRCSRAATELLDHSVQEICGHSIDEFLTQESGRVEIAGPNLRIPGIRSAGLRGGGSGTADIAFRVVPVEGIAEFLLLAARTRGAESREELETMLEGPMARREIDIAVGDLADFSSRLLLEFSDGPYDLSPDPGPATGDREPPADPGPPADAARSGGPADSGPPAVPGGSGPGRWQDQRLRLRKVHDAAIHIGSSLEVREIAQELADLLVPDMGDLVTVDLAESVVVGDEPMRILGGGSLHLLRAAVASESGTWPDKVLVPGAPYPVLPDSAQLRDIQDGQVVTMDRATVLAALDDQMLVDQLVPPGMAFVTVAPLVARGLVLGTLSVLREREGEPFQENERKLLAEVASRAALGVDNARRHNREQRAAVTLQERLLPRATTSSAAVTTAGIYRPAGRGAGIRGDWFDVITLPSLRVALVIGDVVGHGLSATATMGRLRAAIQALADLELDPAELLTHVDDLVQRLAAEAPPDHDPIGATCLYIVYDPLTCQCTLASAGQLPPVAMRPDGTTEFIDVMPGPPLGVGGVPFESRTLELEPESVLALYTNGLFESHHRDSQPGMRDLRSRLGDLYTPGGSLEAMGNALLSALGSRPPGDDIALLLARTQTIPQEHMASWEYPAEPDSVARARRDIVNQLTEWHLDAQVLDSELVISELVTNAVRYAGGPIGVRLIRDTVLICEVTDSSNTQPRLIRADATDEGGRGLFIVAQCTTRWGSRYGRRGKTIWTEQPLP